MTSDQSNAANESSRKLTRKPVIFAAAALIATSALGLTLGNFVPFAAAEVWAERVLAPLLKFDMAPGTLVNVNFPALPADEVKGVRVCRQGIRDYGRLRITQRTDPRGYDYYWFGLGPMVQTPGHSTDLEAIDEGYVTVSPLHLDLTHDDSLLPIARQLDL